MENIIKEGRTRREFLKGAGAVVAGGVVVGVVGNQLSCEELPGVASWWTPDSAPLTPAPAAKAYLVHDTTKCQNCTTCMLACSLVNTGSLNLSLSRRQVTQDFSAKYPVDLLHMDCRQCVEPPCIEICPSGAFHIDADNGNIRTVNEDVCKDYQNSIAPDVCQLCVEHCPYVPSIAIWNHEEGVAMVCDLCKSARYWSEEGGFDGKQACVELCPMNAISVVTDVPSQYDNEGYQVNLRSQNYESIINNSQGRRWWE